MMAVCRPAGPWRVRLRGFTLIEVMITIAIVAILVSIALPSYQEYIRRSSREAAQSQLMELAGTQEKIFLNANAYSNSVTAAYNGNATGGLGAPTGKTSDGRYNLSVSVTGASYTLTATPIAGSTQAADGNLTIDSSGTKTWGSKTW
jgi:type IV pilus assembly protein PilE